VRSDDAAACDASSAQLKQSRAQAPRIMAAAGANQGAEAAIDVLGYAAAVAFAFLLAPQIVLNQKRRSTDGLSLSLVLLWHVAALLYLPICDTYFFFRRAPGAAEAEAREESGRGARWRDGGAASTRKTK